MSNGTKAHEKTIRRAHTVAQAKEIDEAIRTLGAKSVAAYLDGPWVAKGTLNPVPTDPRPEVRTGFRAEYDVEENWLVAEVDGEPVTVAPTRRREYGGDRYGIVIFEIEF